MTEDLSTAYLRVLNGPLRNGVFVLEERPAFDVGRSDGCQVHIPDNKCELIHGQLVRSDDGWSYKDLSTERGSWINDIKVDVRPLEGGEIVRIGETELQFSFDPPRVPPRSDRMDAAAEPEVEIEGAGFAADAELLQLPESESFPHLLRLVVIDGNESDLGREHVFTDDDECVIGRSVSADLVLQDGKISRNHCAVELRDGHLIVNDLGSSNGTVVNGDKVQKTLLEVGDYVRLGFTVLACETVEQAVQ